MLPIVGDLGPDDPRASATLDAIRRELGRGPFVYRYASEDGIKGKEGAFLTCSFWLVHALALAGREDEAASLMEELLGHANDVGLYPRESIPPRATTSANFLKRSFTWPWSTLQPPSTRARHRPLRTGRQTGVTAQALVGGVLGTIAMTTVIRVPASSGGRGWTYRSCSGPPSRHEGIAPRRLDMRCTS